MDEERHIQGIIDFESGNPNGYENWLRQRDARLEAIRREWALPLERKVRIRLQNIDKDFEGQLKLVEQPETIDRRIPLRLRVNKIDFMSPEIEQCIVLE
ncbi:MAG: hypothetical protein K9N48_02655 [Verrucomicrobia bacterium]|nr:hypothetical protein [Verrucomicrobiota bacterium]MCF7709260.1 hypothetical protein [Verrucomicrobiota bacterium]